jgi:hypothetical protein
MVEHVDAASFEARIRAAGAAGDIGGSQPTAGDPPGGSEGELVRFASLALESIERPYPFHLVHVVRSEDDVGPPRTVHPVFHGSFDWHSAVHGHWCVVRALRLGAGAAFAARAWPVLERRLDAERLEPERRYLATPERVGFERPYGLAWLLQLGAELREWDEPRARAWRDALAPLEAVAAERLTEWLPRLPYPIRSGEHSQSAFAMGLALDWARAAGETGFARLIEREAVRLHGADRDAGVHLEPSGHDFLSPTLGEADLMRRVLDFGDFTAWLRGFLPKLDDDRARRWLEPVVSPDLADGKLSHLAGLNLSRAWMLEGVVSALDESAPIAAILARGAARHREAGLAAVTDGPYASTHWLGSFAVYLVTRRGLSKAP